MTAVPISLYITLTIFLFIFIILAFTKIKLLNIVSTLFAIIFGLILSALSVSGSITLYFSAMSSTDALITSTISPELPTQSLIFLMISIIMIMIFACHLHNNFIEMNAENNIYNE